jgi:hypothetical protein
MPAHSEGRRQKSPRCSDRHLRQKAAVVLFKDGLRYSQKAQPPVPGIAVCSNASNILGSASGAIPMPLSMISRRNQKLSGLVERSVTLPPGGVNLGFE